MAKINIDKELCIGCGLCESTCPECFKLGEDMKSHVVANECDKGHDLNEVAANCPVQAITIDEEVK